MKIKIQSAHFFLVGLTLACAISVTSAQAPPTAGQRVLDLTVHAPESVGFSSERLERLHTVMQQAVVKKEVSGVITLLARHGKIVDYRTYGERDMEAGVPMTKDTIFRDYSMTKPVTGVAMMTLFEEGKWLPNDPIAKYIPEFAHLKVFSGMDPNGNMILVDPDHAPTMHELMSHTAGFTYGIFGDTPVDKLVRDAHLFQSQSLQEFIDKLAKLPLLYQPGKGWTYSVSMDIEGYIVEKLSGKTLPDFYRERIFNPLGMKDAAFFVPQEEWSRFAKVYYVDSKGALSPNGPETVNHRDFDKEPALPSGGGGMVSTIEDYYRFAQMLANGGQLNGKRILSQASIKLMTTNHVPEALLTQGFGIGSQRIRPGFGYGYNCAVEYDPQLANLPDGKGTFLWDGAAGTWFWVDPTNDVVFIGMIQRMNTKPTNENLQYESRSLVYQALIDPSK